MEADLRIAENSLLRLAVLHHLAPPARTCQSRCSPDCGLVFPKFCARFPHFLMLAHQPLLGAHESNT